jgi:hypothetical protein
VVIQRLSKLVAVGHVAGIDQSLEMVEQARVRNATPIQSGRVDLRHGSVESLPFDDDSFDKVLAINAMQVWPDPVAGLQEMRFHITDLWRRTLRRRSQKDWTTKERTARLANVARAAR